MKIRLFLLPLLTCLFALTAASNVLAQGHTIRGKVRTAAGMNMSQVTVNLESGNGGGVINQAVTNNEGDFFFGGLTDTSYILTAVAPDFNPGSEQVQFVRSVGSNDPGEMRTVEITMVPKMTRPVSPGHIFAQDVPKPAQTSYENGLKFSKQGKRDEAIAALQEAVRLFPDYFNARFALGNEFMKAGKHNEAIAQLDQARRINPRDDRTYELFGLVLMQLKKYGVAAAVFAEAARLNGLDPQYPLMRGMALIEHVSAMTPTSDKNDAAERDDILTDAQKSLTRAYELSNRKLSVVHLQLARVYERQGARSRAADELEQYLKENQNAQNAGAIREGIKKLRANP